MRITDWVRHLPELEPFGFLREPLVEPTQWRSLVPESRALFLAARFTEAPFPCLLVAANHERALSWHARLSICGVPEDQIEMLPSGISALFEDSTPEANALSDRIGALRRLIRGEPVIVVATAGSALERSLPRDLFESLFHELRVNSQFEEGFVGKLERLGYEPANPVLVPGQVSRRGGILDFWSAGQDWPVRVELFDDIIESIRRFDPATQRSSERVERVSVGPTREVVFPDKVSMDSFVDLISSALETEAAELSDEAEKTLRENVKGDLNNLRVHRYFDRLELYRPLLLPDAPCAVDLLPENGWLILDDPEDCELAGSRAEEDLNDALVARFNRGEILKSTVTDFMVPVAHFNHFSRRIEISDEDRTLTSSLGAYRGQGDALHQRLQEWLSKGYIIRFSTDQPNRARAMLEQVKLIPAEESGALEAGMCLLNGNLAGGFVSDQAKVAFVTDLELFGVGRLKIPTRKFSEGVPIATVLDLKDGDFVVHINFGIGVFRGLITRTQAGVEKEFLFIEYAAPDKLYVPADQLDRIQKYLNPAEANPRLNRLTGSDWQKTVKKAREEAREFARDLIQLYAKRKGAERLPFGPDTPWQAEMESTFPHVETPSQLKAIKEVKGDLNTPYPMDRLVIGDVGFGKTEVALRAAFKVAQSGKQVAMLCPTTILSEQHFRNFHERLASFPMRLELLNRFVKASERRQVLEKLEKGEVDVVIGTHALLSQEVRFKDLGMVIIDEEHKFGVKQKENLKELRVSIDILTLSATPIPRTLSMALMDVRQMSLISDPPPGRLPVRTFVRPHADEVVSEAILRELARGGQVFYVFNRIQGIQHIAERIRKLVPHARIAVGHGQMSENELEPVMVAFIKGEVDVLVSTTIVESGLDIPNANTLIVDHADRMGLAQLYQLRGRVGRSDRQAYAYFLYQSQKSLTENAESRLDALQEFSHLGSGYNLAFRDLQIRGAGELLGAKQHGVMATVGYELYSQLITEEIAFLKAHADGDGQERDYRDPLEGIEPLPILDLPTNARIPEAYVPDQAQRLYYYKALMGSRSSEEVTAVEQELVDRFGRSPDEVKRALWIMRLRILAKELKIEKIDGQGGRLSVTFYGHADLPGRFYSLMQKKNRECYLARGVFIWPYTGGPVSASEKMLNTMQESLNELEEHREALGPLR